MITQDFRNEDKRKFYFLSIEEIEVLLKTNVTKGLNKVEANERIKKIGENEFSESSGPSVIKIFMSNLFNSMNIVLMIALIFSIVVKGWVDVIVLFVVIIINSFIGFFQEFKSEKTLEALKKMSSPTARVLRNCEVNIISCREIVPGDIVYLEEGDIIPADLRLIEVMNLEVDESLLTGESFPVIKQTDKLDETDTKVLLCNQTNCSFKNSLVTKGRGIGIVTATGLNTEVGKIATMLEKYENKGLNEKTPLQKTMDRMLLGLLIVAIFVVIFVFSTSKFNITSEVVLYSISLVIAIVPEGLPAVITVTMTIGVRHMAKEKAIVRRLAALEALGQITDICSDKTGTLTQNKMVVTKCYLGSEEFQITGNGIIPIGDVLKINSNTDDFTKKITSEQAFEQNYLKYANLVCALCNNSSLFFDEVDNIWKSNGDPTEIALTVFSKKLNFVKDALIENDYEFITEFPFDPVIKRMTVVYENKSLGKYIILSKGAIESIHSISSHYINSHDEILTMNYEVQENSKNYMMSYASEGMRVLGLSYLCVDKFKINEDTFEREKIEANQVFLGVIGMYDPPRPESIESVKMCQSAGIVVRMATGDHILTAKSIALKIGIITPEIEQSSDNGNLIMLASDFDNMKPEEIDALPELPLVLARCSPKTKVTLIQALHRRSEKFVAMTGDGVNDAPAVKMADIGIAMGLGGSDVTKQASAMTLTDDNFASIVSAIFSGRRIYENIKKFSLSLLSGCVSEVFLLMAGLFIKDRNFSVFPLSPAQVLYLNMVTSSPIALVLGIEPASKDIMKYKPRPKSSNLFNLELIIDIIFYGILMGSCATIAYSLSIFAENGSSMLTNNQFCNEAEGISNENCHIAFVARAASYFTLSTLIVLQGLNCRHQRLSGFFINKHQGTIPKNKTLIICLVLGIISIFPTVFIPYINENIFRQTYFTWQWIFVICSIIIFIGVSELYKFIKRHFWGLNLASSEDIDNNINLNGNSFSKENQITQHSEVNINGIMEMKRISNELV